MTIKVSVREKQSLRGRVIPRFPINVVGVGGIEIHKQNGVYTFALNPFYPLGDAPYDGLTYGRFNASWTQVVGLDTFNTNMTAIDVRLDALEAGGGGGGGPVAWDDVTGKPATFPPAPHTHTAAEITDFAEATDDRVGALLVAGANITLSYNDAGDALTIAAAAGGGGIADAPSDGKLYGRLNGAWVESYAKTQIDAGLAAKAPINNAAFTGTWGLTGGPATINGAPTADLLLNALAGGAARIGGLKGGKWRWSLNLGDASAESGADAGSHFILNAYADDGVTAKSYNPAMLINRASGYAHFASVGFMNRPAAGGNIASRLYAVEGIGGPGIGMQAADPSLPTQDGPAIFARGSNVSAGSGAHNIEFWNSGAGVARTRVGYVAPGGLLAFTAADFTTLNVTNQVVRTQLYGLGDAAIGAANIANAVGGTAPLETRNGAGGAALFGFHRPGSYGMNFGLDNDNVLKKGGWSLGANSYEMWSAAEGDIINSWCMIQAGGGVPNMINAFGITSVTDNGPGDYTLNFAAKKNPYYGVVGMAEYRAGVIGVCVQRQDGAQPTATACRVSVVNTVNQAFYDAPWITFMLVTRPR